ncbi:MAG: YegS/Rv2252/BmrU family lipid kinase [Lawsonibacter sp.]|nr:YegS/Rv2252/BmrU family lipid kinase [Lawsonibacter sp.]
MNRLLFIYNPTSGTGQIKSSLSPVLDVFTKAGWLTTVYPTQCQGDAARAARELAPWFDRVVCAGGDGTLSEVASGLLELEAPPPLGYIPFGSTNDCANTLKLPKNPREAAVVAAGTGSAVPTDIGRLNDRPFVYVAAFGAFTQVAYDTPQELKHTFGHLAYIFAGIASLPTIAPYHVQIEHDGQLLEDDFFFGMVSNSQSVGGLKPPKSELVVLDDGLFEVTLVKKPLRLADLANGFQALIDLAPADPGALVQFQASSLTFTCGREIPWTIDGEFGGRQIVSQVVNCPRALQIVRGA